MAHVVGVVGGGQLARMMIGPAVELGVDIRVLAEAEGAPAQLAATMVGDYRDEKTVREFASTVTVLTFDHEHVPQPVLASLESDGVAVRPGAYALGFAQDKIAMRRRMAELGLPVPAWAVVSDEAQLDRFISEHGGRAVVKLPVGGYDGHGVRFVSQASEVADWLNPDALLGFPQGLLAEEAVEFTRELSQLSARSPSGEFAAWTLAESVQRGGICVEVVAPAPHADKALADEAYRIAESIASGVGVVGVLAVELFETRDGSLLINELAMRPHNTGHWTMDGSVTGQFEQHLRAVLDLPLGDTALTGAAAVMVNVLGGPRPGDVDEALAKALSVDAAAKVHWYGKEWRKGRKVGHVTVVAGARGGEAVSDSIGVVMDARERARTVARALGAE